MVEEQLKSIDIFKTLDNAKLAQITNFTKIKTLQKEQILFYEGSSSDKFYALIQGSLKLYKTGIKANEIVLHYFTMPTLVAEMATLENINFPATAVAMEEETIVAIIDREKFLAMLEESEFSIYIIKSLTKKIKNLEVAINRNLIFDATTKVCSLIEENSTFLQEYKNIQIANILNMAPETLSRVITKLRKVGVIDKDNHLLDKEKLSLFLDF